MPAVVPETRERRLGRYTLHGEIAAGGMATVHFGRLAGEGGFSRIVAIKCMHKHLAEDPEFRAMFLDEARLAARIRHPNVVSTIDIGSSEEGMFLVMEYVAGESLAALMRACARKQEGIPTSVTIRVLIDALYGLHAAHIATDDAGKPLSIVHRDVSPQNILVATDGHARVLDFGIAKAAGRSHTTRDGQLKGKFRYMAPEQVRDGPVNARTDVYAASVVLWELLTAQSLFRGSNDAAIVAKVLEGVVPAPSKLAPALAPELDAIVLRGLAREPADRFESAEQMAEALEGLSQSTTAKQVSVWVTHVAGEVLRARAEQIARIEAAPSASGIVVAPAAAGPVTSTRTLDVELPDAETAVRPPAAPAPDVVPEGKGAGRALAIVAGTVAASILAGILFVAARTHGAGPSGSASAAASVDPPQEPVPPAVASASEQPMEPSSASPAASATPSATAAHTGAPLPQRPRVRPAGPSAPNCNPPTYLDPSGIRRVKPECL